MPLELARGTISTTLNHLRSAPDISNLQERVAAQSRVDDEIKRSLMAAGHTASDLTSLANVLLAASQDPRRQPIAFRLFEIAYGPSSLVATFQLPAEQRQRIREEARTRARPGDAQDAQVTQQGWWDDEAGYSWAGMILSNAAPPPPNPAHLRERHEEAIETYRRLAERGNANGKLGLGRLLQAQAVSGRLDAHTKDKVVQRVLQLWREAGEAGNAEAWYELGTVHLGGASVAVDESEAERCFVKGADLGHAGSHYALGVLYMRLAKPVQAHEHFHAAAERGDVQSQYNLGLHYLLQPSLHLQSAALVDGSKTLHQLHEERWGVKPDDVLARLWFERASAAHFAPALMNLAALLHEGRGNPPPPSTSSSSSKDSVAETASGATHLTRSQQLQYSAALYAKVVSMGSVSSSLPGSNAGGGGLARFGLDRESAEAMVKLANEEMEKVNKALQEMQGEA
ncbi:uncharacterized protein PFL1_03319 [Pseudozyma flocculosa PF-1]|uniref:Uncharacterized protein n=2 Tax=Pseudozyma flocculosa TaxID=84751 RepID=A0A5C3F681_9BASI|nr:uncharacterized protein PFL1_03319 [Pseudozyma flocculosa PF-1]EPQ29029.1 hypothetical protein PFL1_03319 [Pseudozyma flocculosa PF-1]SPO40023.1 uncharacterized protein PSFLO_05505 [Pseudozyma flocculosa]